MDIREKARIFLNAMVAGGSYGNKHDSDLIEGQYRLVFIRLDQTKLEEMPHMFAPCDVMRYMVVLKKDLE